MNALLVVFLTVIGFAVASEETPLVATTILEAPYVIPRHDKPTKLEDYKGYIPDLLEQISRIIKRKFSLKIVSDGKYGAKDNSAGSYNGMIGEVIRQEAEVAAAAITVSQERSDVVDFTDHFMTFDTIVLLKKDPTTVKIRSAAELRNHSDIKCGVVKDGFTENFFKTTQQDIYKNMYSAMDKDKFPTTSAEGVKQVQNGNGKFAFIIESSTADYWMNHKPCDLVSFRLGSALPYHNYSFAVRKGNTELKSKLNEAIRELKSKGEHDVLRAKWWPTECSAANYRPTYTIGSLVSGLLVALIAATKRL
jgi:ABC-type amino acid transport substrate-binding protein